MDQIAQNLRVRVPWRVESSAKAELDAITTPKSMWTSH